MKIRLYENGLLLGSESHGVVKGDSVSLGATGKVRGKIRSFSSSSRLRLRLALLTLEVKGYRRIGVTLTVPWVSVRRSLALDEFKRVVHRFRVSFLRRFPSCASIFRVELQQRGMPHLHLVSWHPFPFDSDLRDMYFALWFRSVRELFGGSLDGFIRYGVKVDYLPNVLASIRYLCDHSSKKKQAQLGYRGKQWGIWGRDNMVDSISVYLALTDSQSVILLRELRKITRFRVRENPKSTWHRLPCPFGSKLVGGRRSTKVTYISRDTVFRICRSYGFL